MYSFGDNDLIVHEDGTGYLHLEYVNLYVLLKDSLEYSEKDVSKQLTANPKAEICAFKNGEWIRIAGELIEDDRVDARQSMLDAYPSLQKMYAADDGNT